MKKYKLLYILPAALLFACEPEFDDVDFNGGSADFSRTVAVGNSLSAGFQSNALSAEGQEYSLPNMIASQLKQVGGGAFLQPIIPGDAGLKGVGLSSLLPPGLVLPEFVLRLAPDCQGTVGPAPQLASGPYSGAEFAANISANGPFNNIGVPGARVSNLSQAGYGSSQGNPYFARFAGNPLETMLEAAMKVNPTFFELWIGNNDVLGYSTSGGDDGGDAITSTTVFDADFKEALDSLTKNGAKGVVANIPYVTSIPYFTTVPAGTDAITEAQATQLNAGYAAYNAGLDGLVQVPSANLTQAEADRRKISFTAGQFNTFVVIDPTLTDLTAFNAAVINMRQITSSELLTLTTPGDSIRCANWGTAKPIPGNFHITDAELDKIKTAIDAFNATIKAEADARGLAYVDANARLQELATSGITVDGIGFSSAFVSGGAFSLDGVHLSTRGYAYIANDFIKAINAKYAANIPSVVVSSYPAIEVAQ